MSNLSPELQAMMDSKRRAEAQRAARLQREANVAAANRQLGADTVQRALQDAQSTAERAASNRAPTESLFRAQKRLRVLDSWKQVGAGWMLKRPTGIFAPTHAVPLFDRKAGYVLTTNGNIIDCKNADKSMSGAGTLIAGEVFTPDTLHKIIQDDYDKIDPGEKNQRAAAQVTQWLADLAVRDYAPPA